LAFSLDRSLDELHEAARHALASSRATEEAAIAAAAELVQATEDFVEHPLAAILAFKAQPNRQTAREVASAMLALLLEIRPTLDDGS